MGVGGGTFPQSASRDDEEGDWLYECVFACLYECARVSVCARMCEGRAAFRLEFLIK